MNTSGQDCGGGPRSLSDLFLSFTRLALQGFGGVLAVAQVELVERKRWLSRAEFVELLSASQVLPGPNIVNLALMLGDRWFGTRGAVAALGGLVLAPLAIVMALTLVYDHFASVPAVAGALRGMGAVAAGLVLATAFKLLGSLHGNRLGPWLCLAVALLTFGAVALGRVPLAAVIAVLGPLACALAWWRLRA
ncbi:chromate transporter [uncultured Piscinibacter sp.]|uniref:chromate transporter n=1 Tax=uncultured Piscinibacter sp. TaxID=1131835 RepID=UPI002607FB95|nr:chromate transporter [uncultured Piscinibacter sp.]